jgi:hypothetical protein
MRRALGGKGEKFQNTNSKIQNPKPKVQKPKAKPKTQNPKSKVQLFQSKPVIGERLYIGYKPVGNLANYNIFPKFLIL